MVDHTRTPKKLNSRGGSEQYVQVIACEFLRHFVRLGIKSAMDFTFLNQAFKLEKFFFKGF
jgi:hypothetical protein